MAADRTAASACINYALEMDGPPRGDDASGNTTVNAAARTTTGAVAASVAFAAPGSHTGSSASVFINIVRDESAIRYTGKTVVADGTAQTLTALLTDADGVEPQAGRTVTLSIGSVVANATTDANGIAMANVTIPVSAGTGSIRLVASFDLGTGHPLSTAVIRDLGEATPSPRTSAITSTSGARSGTARSRAAISGSSDGNIARSGCSALGRFARVRTIPANPAMGHAIHWASTDHLGTPILLPTPTQARTRAQVRS